MTLPRKFRKSTDEVESFNFSDILLGRSFEVLWAGKDDSTSSGGILRSFVFDSASVQGGYFTPFTGKTGLGYVSGSVTNFDLPFGAQQTVDGLALLNCTTATKKITDHDQNIFIWAYLFRVKDGVEEFLVSGQGAPAIKVQVKNSQETRHIVSLLVPNTVFGIGDILRLRVETWSQDTPTDIQGALGHDPGGFVSAAWLADDSTMKLFMPFKVFR